MTEVLAEADIPGDKSDGHGARAAGVEVRGVAGVAVGGAGVDAHSSILVGQAGHTRDTLRTSGEDEAVHGAAAGGEGSDADTTRTSRIALAQAWEGMRMPTAEGVGAAEEGRCGCNDAAVARRGSGVQEAVHGGHAARNGTAVHLQAQKRARAQGQGQALLNVEEPQRTDARMRTGDPR